MESWLKTFCPKCKCKNWICQGDLQDCTIPDIEVIECCECAHHWLIGEDEYNPPDWVDFICMHGPFDSEEEEDAFYNDKKLPAWAESEEGQQRILKEYGFCEKGRESP
tara:strand:+ start:411 stop:734 length:324 start_codon:yes stop_codon:yes gene_type:complete